MQSIPTAAGMLAFLRLAATAAADYRGQVVCGVPANERITLTMEAADGSWYGCGGSECPTSPKTSERSALLWASYSGDENAYVCEVTAGISRATGVGTAYLYRTGTPMTSNDYDPRVAITAAGGGGGGTDPPGGGVQPGSVTANLVAGADFKTWSFNPRRPNGVAEASIDVRGYFNSAEATVIVLLSCHRAGDSSNLYTRVGESVGSNHFVSLELATTHNECLVAAGAVGADTAFQLAVADTYLLDVEESGTLTGTGRSSDTIRQQSVLALQEHGHRRADEMRRELFSLFRR